MKADMLQMQVLHGLAASPGFASGPLLELAPQQKTLRAAGGPLQESQAMRQALDAAIASLAALREGAEREGREILDVQIALLEDAALSEGAFDAIAAGVAADHAWTTALDHEIAGYLESGDDYFRARASDLADLRDRVLDALTGTSPASLAAGSIVMSDDLAPSRLLASDWTARGIVLRAGSAASHLAMLARSRNIPMIVGVRGLEADVPAQAHALLDGAAGRLTLHPSIDATARFAASAKLAAGMAGLARRHETEPGMTADGQAVAIFINLADVAGLAALPPGICDGIGLVRTEFLFQGEALPDEEAQYLAYRRIVEWAQGRPVTLRTLDVGGDKPVAGLTATGESNPFLGLRGVRLTLCHREMFKTQLRALARAAAHGAVQVMIPMVSVPAELAASRALLAASVAELAKAGVAHRMPALGMMVEVPAAAISIAEFDADFYSIGTNDLTQYVMAAGRDMAGVAHLADCGNSAVLALVRRVVEHGGATGKPVSLCGDAAGDPRVLPMLLATGLRSLSVAPAQVGAVKACLAGLAAGAT